MLSKSGSPLRKNSPDLSYSVFNELSVTSVCGGPQILI